MKKPAFTLLETMIALAVVVLGIAAGANLNRVIFTATLQSEDLLQATALADEGVRVMQLTGQYVHHKTTGDTTLATYFRLNGSSHALVPFTVLPGVPPLMMQWCVEGQGLADSATVCPPGIGAKVNNQSLSDIFTKGELIAVNRVKDSDERLVVDATTHTGATVSTAEEEWDFYYRKIELEQISLLEGVAGQTYKVTVTVSNMLTDTVMKRTILLSDLLP